MSRTTYSEKLRDPRWQRRRLEKLNASDWKCDKCSTPHVTLHVHHVRYIGGREPWEYADDELQVLCSQCHSGEHPNKPSSRDKRRAKSGERYTKLSNAVGRDSRLSYCARGILLMASTHSANWKFTVESIRRGTNAEGQVSIQKSINELKRFGYLKVIRGRFTGKFAGASWNWNFNPPIEAGGAR